MRRGTTTINRAPNSSSALVVSLLLLFSAMFLARGFVVVPPVARRVSFSTLSVHTITSTKSQTVKKIQSLLQKRKKRHEFHSTVVEGPRMVLDLLNHPRTRPLVQQVLVSEDHWDEYASHLPEGLLVNPVAPDVLSACCDTVTPQGIVAIVDIPELPFEKQDSLYLVLDGVSDPGNLGTLLRSSVATGIAGVVLLPGSCDPWSPKAVRSAMGTTFHVPLQTCDSWSECVEWLQEERDCRSIYAATMADDSISHYDVDWTKSPVALVIGSEGQGLSEAVRSDERVQAVHVPMMPSVIESLNAAVCGSVILFEYLRQTR